MQNLKNRYPQQDAQRRRSDAQALTKEKTEIDAQASKVGELAFLSIFEEILVADPTSIAFNGALNKHHMQAIWTWIIRDIAPDLNQIIKDAKNEQEAKKAIISYCPSLVKIISKEIALASEKSTVNNRLTAQLGGEEVKQRLTIFLVVLRCHALLSKASSFGKASNSIEDETALGTALQSMPLQEPSVVAFLFQIIVGRSNNPSNLILAVAKIIGASSEGAMQRAGFEPLLDALLSHAQNQASLLSGQKGLYIDADLMCKSIYRFHKLMHAASGYVELERRSRLGKAATEITLQMAQIVEPRLKEVSSDVSQSLRKPRRGEDKIDADGLLAALNGIYLLAAVREAKESLALNALFDRIWSETGKNLEILLDRNLEEFKKDTNNSIVSQRLDMGIKMAKIRFGEEYAGILQNAKDKVSRRSNEA